MRFDSILTAPYKEQLTKYAPGVDATIKDDVIAPFIHASQKAIANIVGDDTWTKIRELNADDELQKETVASLCNLIMYNYKVWEVVQKRQVSKMDTYKYELELMQSSYIDNYFNHIDDVLKLLNSRQDEFKSWAQHPSRKQIDNLLIKDATEFNTYYLIDNSYYFFWISIFLQQKVLDRHINPVVDLTTISDMHLRRIKIVTAQLTVAYSLRQFDFVSLPKSIRNAYADGAWRSAYTETESVRTLSDFLFSEAEKELSAIVRDVNRSANDIDISSETSTNDEFNKFFLMI